MEALGHERIGLVPQEPVPVHGPGHHQHLRAAPDLEFAELFVFDRLAVDGWRRRIKPHRLLEGGACIRHGVEPLRRVFYGGNHRIDLGFHPFAFPGRLGEAVECPAQRTRGGLVAGADEGDDVVLDLATRKPVRALGAQQQRQEILRHVARCPFHALAPHLHRVGHDLAEIGHGVAATDPREARQPVGRAQQIERVDAPHGLEQPVYLLLERAGFTRDLA